MKKHYDQYLKNFYTITGPFDEYKQAVVGKVLIKLFPILFDLVLLACAVAFIASYRYPQLVAWILPATVALIVVLVYTSLNRSLVKAKINDFDLEELDEKQRKSFRFNPVRAGLLWTSTMFVWNAFSQVLIDGSTIVQTFQSPRLYISTLIEGILFFIGMRIINSRMLKKKEEEKSE